jgi:hypothetical protein
MSNLGSRIEALERQSAAPLETSPIRLFTCDGTAEDGGPDLADSPQPAHVPSGYIWAMTICGCAAEQLAACRYGDADDPACFTIAIDRGNALGLGQ